MFRTEDHTDRPQKTVGSNLRRRETPTRDTDKRINAEERDILR
jgi:hypothetical protein